MKADESHIIKIVMTGPVAAGKTSLVSRYFLGHFNKKEDSTVGASFVSKKVTASNSKKFVLELWDTAGEERYRSLLPLYYRGADAVIVLFDSNDRNGLQNIIGKKITLKTKQELKIAINQQRLGKVIS